MAASTMVACQQDAVKSWCKVCELNITTDKSNFLRALNIWLTKPHTLNRRLCGVKVVFERCFSSSDCLQTLGERIIDNPEQCWADNYILTSDSIQSGQGYSPRNINYQVRDLVCRNIVNYPQVKEIILFDDNGAIFIPSKQSGPIALTPPYPYQLKWNNYEKRVELWLHTTPQTSDSSDEEPSKTWLCSKLLPRLKKWAESEPISPGTESLRLVPVDKYNDLYQHLKVKYGQSLVQNWPEKTDPSKFVYEDLAIAAYLMLIWEEERIRKKLETKQSFVDLGCGNGLLVYILTKEGYSGLGLDVRKRKIWDIFGSDIKLEVNSINPSHETKFEYDWLIGNHSDELTPWIPVMAARSSYKTNFFVLPCCPHDFDRKYQRSQANQSQYCSYISYVKEIAEVCGFTTAEDKLRIPSTKRICIIGSERTYAESEEAAIDTRRAEFIFRRCQRQAKREPSKCKESFGTSFTADKDAAGKGDVNFQARSAVERVRNCTQLDKTLITKIVDIVSSELLKHEDYLSLETHGEPKKWNSGGRLHLSDVKELLDTDDLKKLKSECGGVQTLLKNNGHVFLVTEGHVKLQNYSSDHVRKIKRKNISKVRQIKTKPCWFDVNHPNGCVLPESQCKYVHNKNV